MKAVIVYATNSGGTYQVAQLIADQLEVNGYTVTVLNAPDAPANVFHDADLCLLGSNTWEWVKPKERLEGQLNDQMRAYIERVDTTSIQGQKFALFALGDKSYTDFCAAADHLEKFVASVNGTLVTPTLRMNHFYFDLEKNRQLVTGWAAAIR